MVLLLFTKKERSLEADFDEVITTETTFEATGMVPEVNTYRSCRN
jgi:hypothetical protein